MQYAQPNEPKFPVYGRCSAGVAFQRRDTYPAIQIHGAEGRRNTGIAYIGAIKAMEENGVTAGIQKVSGISVSAITGMLYCMGYTAAQMQAIMEELDIADFNDGSGYFIDGQKRLRKDCGPGIFRAPAAAMSLPRHGDGRSSYQHLLFFGSNIHQCVVRHSYKVHLIEQAHDVFILAVFIRLDDHVQSMCLYRV